MRLAAGALRRPYIGRRKMIAIVLYVYVHEASPLGLRFLVNNESCVAIYLPLLFYVFRLFLGFPSSFVISSPPPRTSASSSSARVGPLSLALRCWH